MEVEVPESVDVGDLVGAGLAQGEGLAVGMLAMAALARTEQALLLHEPAHGRVAGDRPEARVLARERDEVVVVKLEGPSRMVTVLLRDGLGERSAQAWMAPGVRGDFAREGGQRIASAARDVPPALDGLEREADGLAGGGVSPRTCGERLDVRLELAVVGGGGHQRPEDLKAQTCPSHARVWRVVVVGHGAPALQPWTAAARRTLRRRGKHGQRHLLREHRERARLHRGPQPA